MAPPVRGSCADAVQPSEAADATAASGSTAARTSRASSGSGCEGRRGDAGDHPPRRGARARRLAPHASRCARLGPPTPTSSPTTTRPSSSRAFTFHGFRYAEVETDGRGPRVRTFVAISSDTPRRGWFACSDARLDRFHENVVWSQRDNFVSVPTDCPQRDERLGWTGDAQAFAPTACTLFDSRGVLGELAARPRAGPGRRARRALRGARRRRARASLRFGRAGWADAATIVPWAVYESYGDAGRPARPARQHAPLVDSLRGAAGARWAARARACSSATGSTRTRRPNGPGRPRPTPTFLANAYFVLERPARGGRRRRCCGDAGLGGRGARAGASGSGARPGSAGREHAMTTQTGCAVALRFGLVPEDERDAVVATRSPRWCASADGRVRDRLPGHAARPAGARRRRPLRRGVPDAAAAARCRRGCTRCDQGATTVWERWDAIRPDGSIHPGP